MSIKVYGPTILVDNIEGQRNIIVSVEDPSPSQGRNGDIWIKYTA